MALVLRLIEWNRVERWLNRDEPQGAFELDRRSPSALRDRDDAHRPTTIETPGRLSAPDTPRMQEKLVRSALLPFGRTWSLRWLDSDRQAAIGRGTSYPSESSSPSPSTCQLRALWGFG